MGWPPSARARRAATSSKASRRWITTAAGALVPDRRAGGRGPAGVRHRPDPGHRVRYQPRQLSMYARVPDALPAGAARGHLHGCTQARTTTTRTRDGRSSPTATASRRSSPDERREQRQLLLQLVPAGRQRRGGGQALSIKQMVDGSDLAVRGSDPGRVFITGLSAGGGMTANMLATPTSSRAAPSTPDCPLPAPTA
ncbi:hypothetical protein LV779_16070 [Streptomyces thinghirensis]|nr:hypothetical protein [Streptomyces thinghirensis]